MPGKAMLIFGLLLCSLSEAQNLNYSRVFPTVSKNLPLLILNTQAKRFYVLRYNRKAHDLTLECRSKPTAEILHFTPLKMDSVNSGVFNYSSLDYRLFEHKNNLYFVFKKNLNNQISIHFKRIDSTGRSGGFTEISFLKREVNWLEYDLELSGIFNGKLLLISRQKFLNESTKKTAMLYDLEKKRWIWTKTLPLENNASGYSKGFCVSVKEDLLYVMIKAQIVSYQRKYVKHMQLMEPVLFYDSLHLIKLSSNNPLLQRKFLTGKLNALHSLNVYCDTEYVRVIVQAAGKMEDNTQNIFFLTCKINTEFSGKLEPVITFLDPGIKKRLTYYDGTDYNQAANKQFKFLYETTGKEFTYHLTERKEGEIYKELLLWKMQNSTGKVVSHYLIPRRMLSSETWSRYEEIGKASISISGENLLVFIAEAPANANSDPNTTGYYQLKKKSSLNHCYLMVYTPESKGVLAKRKLHHNQEFDFIPIDYKDHEKAKSAVFYLSNGKQEKFAILEL